MRQLRIEVDDRKFQAEMKRSGNGAVPLIGPRDMALLSPSVTILIGNRTPAMGGGLAGTGYVMQNGKATHSIAVSPSDVQKRFMMIP